MSRAKHDGVWCEYIRVPVEPEPKVSKKVLMVDSESSREFRNMTEAAGFVGKDVSTVWRWLKKGRGGGCKWYIVESVTV